MNTLTNRLVGTVGVIGLMLILGVQSHAQDLPKGEEILDKYIEVTGGKDAYAKVTSRVASGTIEIPALNIKGKVTIYQAMPNKVYSESEIPGITKAEEGTNGEVVWENSTTNGPRIKEGVERSSYLRRHALDGDVNWRKYYTKAECKGIEKIDGKECYKVEMTPKEGAVETQFYDKATGLVTKTVTKEKTQFGDVDIEANVVEHRKVDGITMPSKIKQKVLTNEIVISLDKVEHNTKIPDEKFKLPEDIQKLADKAKKPEK